jgi:FtsZ-binding cell division protein ZapB
MQRVEEVEIDMTAFGSPTIDSASGQVSYANSKMKFLAVSGDNGGSWELVAANHYMEDMMSHARLPDMNAQVHPQHIDPKTGLIKQDALASIRGGLHQEALEVVSEKNDSLLREVQTLRKENKELRRWNKHLEGKLLEFVDLAFDKLREDAVASKHPTKQRGKSQANGAEA